MRYYDMLWMKDSKWYYYDGLVPVIREDAPEKVKRSFENYLQQLSEEHEAARKPE